MVIAERLSKHMKTNSRSTTIVGQVATLRVSLSLPRELQLPASHVVLFNMCSLVFCSCGGHRIWFVWYDMVSVIALICMIEIKYFVEGPHS